MPRITPEKSYHTPEGAAIDFKFDAKVTVKGRSCVFGVPQINRHLLASMCTGTVGKPVISAVEGWDRIALLWDEETGASEIHSKLDAVEKVVEKPVVVDPLQAMIDEDRDWRKDNHDVSTHQPLISLRVVDEISGINKADGYPIMLKVFHAGTGGEYYLDLRQFRVVSGRRCEWVGCASGRLHAESVLAYKGDHGGYVPVYVPHDQKSFAEQGIRAYVCLAPGADPTEMRYITSFNKVGPRFLRECSYSELLEKYSRYDPVNNKYYPAGVQQNNMLRGFFVTKLPEASSAAQGQTAAAQ
jgi:hypothetical protein